MSFAPKSKSPLAGWGFESLFAAERVGIVSAGESSHRFRLAGGYC